MYLILFVPVLSPPSTLMSTFILYLSLGHLHHLPERSRTLDRRDQNARRDSQSLQGTQENCDPRVTCKLQRRMRTSPRQVLASLPQTPSPTTKQQKAERGLGWPGTQTCLLRSGVAATLVPQYRRNQPILRMNDLSPKTISLPIWGRGVVSGEQTTRKH